MSEQNEIKRLSSIIERKDIEIQDIKTSLADILQQIRDINESVNEIDPEVKRRKISEMCTNTIYELLVDEKNRTITTDQSNK
ncbi:MAG: hypothetical protein ACLU07_01360 [Lachnospirales bacterium]|jgi:hypothetical protein|nr:MAG TPA: hypothetical protein [Caudoviricetes sp.]